MICLLSLIGLAVFAVDGLRVEELTGGRRNGPIAKGPSDTFAEHTRDGKLASESHFQSTTPDSKLLLLIGDSVDRYAVDDWCEAQDEGARLYYGQNSDKASVFGTWSEMGEVDQQLQDMLRSSGVTAWMSWMVRVCIVSRRGVAVASIFNVKGVDPQGPWWHQDIVEKKFGMQQFCGPQDLDPSCHDFVKFLQPPVRAIQSRFSLVASTTVINSNFWDVSRKAYYSRSSIFSEYANGAWTSEARNLIKAVRQAIPPQSQLLWRTANLPENKEGEFLRRSATNTATTDKSFDDLYDFDVPPTAYYRVQALNAAARQLCRDESIELLDVESRNYSCRDGSHPLPKHLAQMVEELLQV